MVSFFKYEHSYSILFSYILTLIELIGNSNSSKQSNSPAAQKVLLHLFHLLKTIPKGLTTSKLIFMSFEKFIVCTDIF